MTLEPRTEEDRRERGVSPGSSIHLLISLLYENGEMMTHEVHDELPEVKDGTVGYALTEAYTRMLIDRERVEAETQHASWTSRNRLTDHGRTVVEELGTITESEWVNQ